MKKSKNSLSETYLKIFKKDIDTIGSVWWTLIFVLFLSTVLVFTLGPATPEFETEATTLKEFLATYDNVHYLFSLKSNEGFVYALGGLASGVASMSFLHKKNKLYTLLSQPLNRKTIYFNRAVFTLIIGILLIFVPKLYALWLNADTFGFSWELLGAFTPHLIVCFSIFTFAFTAGVGCSLFNGKTMYATESAAIITFFFTAFTKFINIAIEHLLYGAGVNTTASIKKWLSIIDPIKKYPLSEATSTNITEGTFFTSPEFISAVIWLIISIFILRYLSKYFVKSYKPEICEAPSPHNKMLFVSDFFGTFAGMGIFLLIIDILPFFRQITLSYIFVCLLFPTVLLLIGNPINTLVITHSRKKAGLTALSTLSAIAVMGLISIFFYTNMFGFYNKLPEKKDIESVVITSPVDNFNRSSALTSELYLTGTFGSTTGITLTTPEDIELALKFNEVLFKNRKQETSSTVSIAYRTKNGKTNTHRIYKGIGYEAIEKAKEFWNTDGRKNHLQKNYIPEDIFLTKSGEKGILDYKECDFSITSLYQENIDIKVKISPEESLMLRRAILKDTLNLSVEERYYPTAKYLGTVHHILQFKEELVCNNKSSSYFRGDAPIYDNMENTISVLKQLKLYDLLTKERKITSAYITDYQTLKKQAIESSLLLSDENITLPTFENPVISMDNAMDSLLTWEKIPVEKAKKLLDQAQSYYLVGESDMKALIVMYPRTPVNEKKGETSQKLEYNIYLLPQTK